MTETKVEVTGNNNRRKERNRFCRKKFLLIMLFVTFLVLLTAILCYMLIGNQGSSLYPGSSPQIRFSEEIEESRDHLPLASKYSSAAISVDAAQCSPIGIDVLQRLGGNAVDASIAVLFCMGLVIPESMGLGGGSFFNIFMRNSGKVTIINSRERAPAYAFDGMFSNDSSASSFGVDAIAIPGELAGYWEAHQRFGSGRVEFADLIQPTIDLARNGFKVGSHLENAIKKREANFIKYHTKDLVKILKNPLTGKFYKLGEMMKREDLAATLEIIQKEGKDSIYSRRGTIARQLINDLESQGSRLRMEDLINFVPRIEEPEFRILPNGMNFYSSGLPSSGPILGFMLDTVMRSLRWTPKKEKLSQDQIFTFDRYLVEAFKFGYGQRGFLGDPDFEKNVRSTPYESTAEALARLQSITFSDDVANRIRNLDQTMDDPSMYQQPLGLSPITKPWITFASDDGTAAMTIIDAEGNAVVASTTINAYWGSYVVSPSTGIILNNEMDDFGSNFTNEFGVTPSDHNRIAAGKVPLSSMCPTILTTGRGNDQQVMMTIGASGGTQITTSTALVILRSLLFKDMSLASAVAEARIHHQLIPNKLAYESRDTDTGIEFPADRLKSLVDFGHLAAPIAGRGSIVMSIKRSDDEDAKLEAVTDWRKGGSVEGF